MRTSIDIGPVGPATTAAGRHRARLRGLVVGALALGAVCATAAAQHTTPGAVTLEWERLEGEITWGFEFPLAVDQSADAVFVANGRIASPYRLSAYELNGDLRWTYETAMMLGGTLAVHPNGGTVYALGYDAAEPALQRAKVLAFRSADGQLLWSSYLTSWSGEALVQPAQDLILSDDGATLFAAGQENEIGTSIKGFAVVGAFDSSSGGTLWLRRFEPPANRIWSMDRLTFGADGASLFAAGGSGSLQVPELLAVGLDVTTGNSRWERLLPAGRPFDLVARPDGSDVAIASERAGLGPDLFVLDASDGSERLSGSYGDALISAAYSADSTRLVINSIEDGAFPGSQLDQLRTIGLSASTGLTVWSRDFSTPWGSPGGIDFDPEARECHLAHDPATNAFVVAGSRQPTGGPEDHQVVVYAGNSGTILWSESFDVTPAQTDQRLRAVDVDPSGQRVALFGDAADELDLQSVRVGLRDLDNGFLTGDWTVAASSSAADTPLDLAASADGTRLFQLSQTNFGKYRVSGHVGDAGEPLWSATLEVAGAGFDPLPPSVATDALGAQAFFHLTDGDSGQLHAFEGSSGDVAWVRSAPAVVGSSDAVGQRLVVDNAFGQVLLGGLSPVGGLEVQAYGFDGGSRWLLESAPGAKFDAFGGIDALQVDGKELLVLAGVRTGGLGSTSPFSKSLRLALYDAGNGFELWDLGFPWSSPYLEVRDVALSKGGDWIAVQVQTEGPKGPLTTVLHRAEDGTPVWLDTRGSQAEPRRGRGVAFAVDDQLVVSAAHEFPGSENSDVLVEAVFTLNGQPAWSRRIDGGAGDELGDWELDADGLLLVGTGARGLYDPAPDAAYTFGLDGITGQELWSAAYDSPADLGAPILDDAGRALALSADGNAVFGGYRVWNGAALSDSMLVRYRMPRLLAGVEAVAIGSGGSQVLSLRQPNTSFGDLYLIVGSGTGTSPALPLDGVSVPLVLDGYTLQTIAGANAGAYVNTMGFADAAGRATARIDVPAGLPASLAGVTLHHAAVTIDVGGTWGLSFATNAMPLALTF